MQIPGEVTESLFTCNTKLKRSLDAPRSSCLSLLNLWGAKFVSIMYNYHNSANVHKVLFC